MIAATFLFLIWPVVVLHRAMDDLHPGRYSMRDAFAVYGRTLAQLAFGR